MSYSFVIQKDHFEILKELGQKEAPNEVGAFLLAQKIDSRLSTRLVARELVLFEPDELEQSSFLCAPTPKALSRFLTKFKRSGLHRNEYVVVYVHTHPFAKGTTRFSSIDHSSMSSDRTTVYDPHFGDMKSAWLVFNSHFNSFDGRLIERGGHITHNIDQIIIIGKHLERLYRNPLKKSKELNDEKKFSRMSIIPGIDLDKYRNWNIGLVGLGGNGASCLESIVMMGVGDGGNLVLVDHDSIEVSNLSRIPYTSDVHLGMPKVQVAKKYLREIQPGRKCTALKNRVWDAEAQEYLKGVDLLFINSDNDLCRYYASYFSSLYSIPLMDAGAGVISHQGELSSIGGQVRVQIPGVTPCLMCNMGLDLSRVEAALPWKKDELSVEVRRELANEGYFSEELQGPSPSVFYLNQMCASLTSVMTSQLLQNGIVHPGVTFELRPPYMMTAINVESEEGCPICHDSTLAYENPKLLTLEKLFNRETLSHPFPVGPNAEKELKQ